MEGELRKAQLPVPRIQGARCPTCTGLLKLIVSMLDIRAEKTVRLFRCATCGEQVWDE